MCFWNFPLLWPSKLWKNHEHMGVLHSLKFCRSGSGGFQAPLSRCYSSSKITKTTNFSSKIMHIDVTYYSIAYRILSVASPLYIKPVQVDLCTLGLFWRGDTVEVREMESLSYCHLVTNLYSRWLKSGNVSLISFRDGEQGKL